VVPLHRYAPFWLQFRADGGSHPAMDAGTFKRIRSSDDGLLVYQTSDSARFCQKRQGLPRRPWLEFAILSAGIGGPCQGCQV